MISLTGDFAEEPAGAISPPVSDADTELIAACLKDDRAAQSRLYKKYYGTMMAIGMRYLGQRDDALEVVNNAFLKVFLHLDSYEGKGSFEGWIKRIVYHCALDRIKQNIKYKNHVPVEDYPITVDETVVQKLYTQDLLKLLLDVPLASRTVFNLFVMEGLKHEEIARELGISAGTSKWHLSEARKTLKQLIEMRYSR